MKQRARILIVDDNEKWQEFYKDLLTSRIYRIEVARSFWEAKTILSQESFEVAIVDIRLGENDAEYDEGFAVLELLNKTRRQTNTIVVTAYATPALAREAFQYYKVLDFIPKLELNASEFIDTVERGVQESLAHQADVFVSYARDDFNIVQDIYQILLANRHHPWLDVYSLKGGENWLRAIYRAIDECEVFLAVLSNNSVSRRGVVQKELKKALDKWAGMLPQDIYILPIRIDDCPIPELLQDIQVINWQNGKGEAKLLEAIETALARRKSS